MWGGERVKDQRFFLPQERKHTGQTGICDEITMNADRFARITGPRPGVKGRKEAILAHVEEDWEGVLGAPEIVSCNASNRTAFPDISLCIAFL